MPCLPNSNLCLQYKMPHYLLVHVYSCTTQVATSMPVKSIDYYNITTQQMTQCLLSELPFSYEKQASYTPRNDDISFETVLCHAQPKMKLGVDSPLTELVGIFPFLLSSSFFCKIPMKEQLYNHPLPKFVDVESLKLRHDNK